MLECQLEIRVEWGHCDPAQIVYNPNFFDWMERGLSALFEAAGLGFSDLIGNQKDMRGTPLVRSHADFLAPARVGDIIVLTSMIARWGRASFDIAYEFHLGDTKLVSATQTRVWAGVDKSGTLKARPIPDEVRSAFETDRTVRYLIAREDVAPSA
jgi:4-hydroxybenzoyl-CoA thioesterase